jgi:tetratricopeptide (TPR) repeat protein
VRVTDPLLDGLQELVRGERLYLLRGQVAFDARRFAEAATAFRKAVAANPASTQARVNLGSALAELGAIKDAVAQFNEVLRLNPGNTAAHYNLGLLLANQNQHAQALTHFQAVLNVNPKDVDARFLLAQVLLKAGRPQEALAEFTRVVAAEPNHEEALLEQVKLLFRARQYQQARASLEHAHKRFPQKGRTAAMLAWLLAASPELELRDGTKALELARLIYQSTGLVNHGAVVAMALAELGRCSEAAALQRQMIAAAEREQKTDFAAKLKADLLQYEKTPACRPQSTLLSTEPTPPERKKP